MIDLPVGLCMARTHHSWCFSSSHSRISKFSGTELCTTIQIVVAKGLAEFSNSVSDALCWYRVSIPKLPYCIMCCTQLWPLTCAFIRSGRHYVRYMGTYTYQIWRLSNLLSCRNEVVTHFIVQTHTYTHPSTPTPTPSYKLTHTQTLRHHFSVL